MCITFFLKHTIATKMIRNVIHAQMSLYFIIQANRLVTQVINTHGITGITKQDSVELESSGRLQYIYRCLLTTETSTVIDSFVGCYVMFYLSENEIMRLELEIMYVTEQQEAFVRTAPIYRQTKVFKNHVFFAFMIGTSSLPLSSSVCIDKTGKKQFYFFFKTNSNLEIRSHSFDSFQSMHCV